MAEKKFSEFLPARTPLTTDLVPTLRSTDPASTANDVSTLAAIGGLTTLSGIVDAKRDFGATGNGVTDDTATLQAALDDCFGSIASPHGTANVTLNKILYIPPGTYKLTDSLKVKYLHGGKIIGAGRFVTTLSQFGAFPVFQTNGCGYSHFEGIRFWANTGQACFDLDWDGTAGGAALQSNTFADCFFHDGNYGLKIGQSNFMGSETSCLNCFFLSQTVAGLATLNYNAVQQTIIGGNFQGCAIGVWTAAGSCNVIHGVGFQLSTTADIQTEVLVNNTMSVNGCRSESTNFIANHGSQSMHIAACGHISGTGTHGDFYHGVGGQAVIDACRSTKGRIHAEAWAQIRIAESSFARDAWLQITGPRSAAGNDGTPLCLEIENTSYGWGETGNVEIRRQRILGTLDGVSTTTYNYDVTAV